MRSDGRRSTRNVRERGVTGERRRPIARVIEVVPNTKGSTESVTILTRDSIIDKEEISGIGNTLPISRSDGEKERSGMATPKLLGGRGRRDRSGGAQLEPSGDSFGCCAGSCRAQLFHWAWNRRMVRSVGDFCGTRLWSWNRCSRKVLGMRDRDPGRSNTESYRGFGNSRLRRRPLRQKHLRCGGLWRNPYHQVEAVATSSLCSRLCEGRGVSSAEGSCGAYRERAPENAGESYEGEGQSRREKGPKTEESCFRKGKGIRQSACQEEERTCGSWRRGRRDRGAVWRGRSCGRPGGGRPKDVAAKAQGSPRAHAEDPRWRSGPRTRHIEKETARRRLCLLSGREEAWCWDQFGPRASASPSPGRRSGYKRWSYDRDEEEHQEKLCWKRVAGTGRATPATGQEEEARQEEKWNLRREDARQPSAGQRKEEKEKEEEGKSSKGRARAAPELKQRRRGRGKRVRGWGQRVRQRVELRATPPEEILEVPRFGASDAREERSGAIGPKLDGGPGWAGQRSEPRSENQHLLCAADTTFLPEQSPLSAGALCARPLHRPLERRKVVRSWRRIGQPLRRRPHSIGGRILEYSRASGVVPLGAGPISQHRGDAASSKTQKDEKEISGLPTRDLVVRWRTWPRRTRRREGEEGTPERKRKRKGQRWQRDIVEPDRKRRREPLGKQQGGSAEEERLKEAAGEWIREFELELGNTLLPPLCQKSGLAIFREVLTHCTSLHEVGSALGWLVFNLGRLKTGGRSSEALEMVVAGKLYGAGVPAVHRGRGCKPRPLFPLPLLDKRVVEVAQRTDLKGFVTESKAEFTEAQVWAPLLCAALNGLAGFHRAVPSGCPNSVQKMALEAIDRSAARGLGSQVRLQRTAREAEKELSSRFLSYTGEEA